MLNRMKAWKEKKQIESFFRPDVSVWLMDTSNSRMRKYVSCNVRKRFLWSVIWIDQDGI